MKRFLSSLIASAVALSAFPSFSMSSSAAEPLTATMSYMTANQPYVVVGEEASWDLFFDISGYVYNSYVQIATKPLGEPVHGGTGWEVCDSMEFDVNSDEFSYTFTEEAYYFLQFTIYDEYYNTVTIQSQIFEVYSESSQTDNYQASGRVNSIIEEVITDDMSDYSRALALHDWLICNANYDFNYEKYLPECVLVYGQGVCESYANAYSMLLAAAGIESTVVTGVAGQDADSSEWGAHAWNLVNIGGEWYHVDCTWDDPGVGGYECHDYFLINDEQMSKDHKWSQPGELVIGGCIVPDATADEYAFDYPSMDYDFEFSTLDELDTLFNAEIANGNRADALYFRYTGEGSVRDFYENSFKSWTTKTGNKLVNNGTIEVGSGYSYGYKGDILYISNLKWNNPTDYIRITENEIFTSVNTETTVIPSAYVMTSGSFICESSNPDVAEAYCDYDATDEGKLIVYISGYSEGTATITITPADGSPAEKFNVTVLPLLHDEFEVNMTSENGQLTLQWDDIIGVTEYAVVEMIGDEAVLLDVVDSTSAVVTPGENDNGKRHTVYVEATRVIDGNNLLTYVSEDKVIDNGNYSFEGGSVAIDKKIGVSFYMDINVPLEADAYMQFTMADGSTREIAVSDAQIDTTVSEDEELYVFTCDVNTKEMSDIIKAQIINGDDKSRVFEYSVKEYADDMLAAEEGTYSAETITLVKAMLNYGGYAQQYLGYNTDNLANADLDNTDVSFITYRNLKIYAAYSKSLEGVGTFAGTSLSLKSNIILNVYFQPEQGVDAEDLVFEINDEKVTAEKKGSYLVVSYEFPHFADLNVEIPFTVSLASDNSKTLSFDCSALSYCYSVLLNENSSDALANAVKAIYIYYDAAISYVSSLGE